MPEPPYDSAYAHDMGEWARASAAVAVPIVLDLLGSRPASVVDVGCGSGEWLAAFAAHGVREIAGADGPWVPVEALAIRREQFLMVDLAETMLPLQALGHRFDLVVSLEVAEHLPPAAAASFVTALTELGDTVLFSAAVPGQGGRDHRNEQWPSYWVDRFASHGFDVVDAVRPRVWDDARIAWWYRQNMLLFVNAAGRERYSALPQHDSGAPLALVHPDRVHEIQEREAGYRDWVAVLEAREAELDRQIAELQDRARELAAWGDGLRDEVRALTSFEPGRVSLRRVLASFPALVRHAVLTRLTRSRR